MHESPDFLQSLNHNNPFRPRFVIKPDEFETLLEISYRGRCMEVPISEILSFAARWQGDRERRRAEDPCVGLWLHPYPLNHTRISDADCPNWWVED